MNKYSLQLRFIRIFISSALLLLVMLMTAEEAFGQTYTYPQIPRLSLTGEADGYDVDWYPNGRVIHPVRKHESGNAGNREILLPVFIDNKWWHYQSTDYGKYLVPAPIHSFKFKISYDGIALTPIEIVTAHPFPVEDTRAINVRGDYIEPLAKDFNITFTVHKDTNYKKLLAPDVSPLEKAKGQVMVITASGTQPLPCTDTSTVDFNVLLYVKFRMNLDETVSGNELPSLTQPIYINHDTILYNDWNVREEIAFKHLLYSDTVKIADLYPDPKLIPYVGITGINNSTVPPAWAFEPTIQGMIYTDFTRQIPKLWYDISRDGSQPPVWNWEEHSNYTDLGVFIMRDPLTVDSGKVHKPTHVAGTVRFIIKNDQTNSRITDLWVESDAPWLTFDLESDNRSKYVKIDDTRGYIYYIDNGILGGGAANADPLGVETQPDVPMWINVKCDPELVVEHEGEKAGIYTGYITFRSQSITINPVRMKFTFINFRNPFEPDDGFTPGVQHRGITLTVRNSQGATGQETKLVFGTAHRATESFDSLFGEFPYPGALSGFGARFYHPDKDFREEHDMPFGFGDMLPNRENPFSASRDIRDINDTVFSHIYLCRFDANGAQNYPIVIEWDTTDFPVGAQIFLSDTLNGDLFPSINMRQGTHVSGNILSYSIQDPKITSFKIEYTLPRIVNYVDAYGNPKIQSGWNLLSLPVRPNNLMWNVVYPSAMNMPYVFFGDGYQEHIILQPGLGYFIKYSDRIDKQFKGTPMTSITMGSSDDGFDDKVHLYPGWNTIGALSVPLEVSEIRFDPYPGQKTIDRAAVLAHGYWGYKTSVGYYETSIIDPGLGYWMKTQANEHGYLKMEHPLFTKITNVDVRDLSKQRVLNNGVKLTIRDNGQHESHLYMTNDNNAELTYFELPPLPPAGLFDVRFNTNRIVEYNDNNIIKLQGVDYPVSVAMNGADANYTFVDAYSGEVLGTINKGESKNIEINSTISNSIKVLKSDIEGILSVASYPNPVESASTINYTVPIEGHVSIKLFDALGNAVQLFEGWKTAGTYSAPLDVQKLASGSYLCKISLGSNTATTKISVVK